MEQNPFKTKKFQDLFKEWNKKLEEAGHEEIENFNLPIPTLKLFHATEFRKKALKKDLDQQRDTYLVASHLLNTYKFLNEDHRRVWELYCDGISARETAKIINKKGFKKDAIRAILTTIKKEIR